MAWAVGLGCGLFVLWLGLWLHAALDSPGSVVLRHGLWAFRSVAWAVPAPRPGHGQPADQPFALTG